MGFWIAKPASSTAPTIESSVINPPYGPRNPVLGLPSSHQRTSSPSTKGEYSGRHSTRAEKQISEQALANFLRSGGSPLAEYASQISSSPYYSTIIGICWIEQYHCTKAPYNNYWGIMGNGGLKRFATLEDGIQGISDLLAKYETKGKDTIEELNGYYVVPASSNWLNTVIKIKQEVESL